METNNQATEKNSAMVEKSESLVSIRQNISHGN